MGRTCPLSTLLLRLTVTMSGSSARLAGNVTGKIEYLHMDFGAERSEWRPVRIGRVTSSYP
jgi:hypothetical protein